MIVKIGSEKGVVLLVMVYDHEFRLRSRQHMYMLSLIVGFIRQYDRGRQGQRSNTVMGHSILRWIKKEIGHKMVSEDGRVNG